MVAQLPMNSILLRSRASILATARICHNHAPSSTLISSSSPARSYYSSSPEQQSLQQSQLNPSHVQLSPGMTFASPQQQNHVWMSPVRTLIYIYIYNHMSGTFAQCPTKLIWTCFLFLYVYIDYRRMTNHDVPWHTAYHFQTMNRIFNVTFLN